MENSNSTNLQFWFFALGLTNSVYVKTRFLAVDVFTGRFRTGVKSFHAIVLTPVKSRFGAADPGQM